MGRPGNCNGEDVFDVLYCIELMYGKQYTGEMHDECWLWERRSHLHDGSADACLQGAGRSSWL